MVKLKGTLDEYKMRNPQESLPNNALDYLPYAIEKKINLLGTVKSAVLIDGGVDEMGVKVVGYLKTYGVLPNEGIDSSGTKVDNLSIIVSHMHDDHYKGLKYLFWKPKPITVGLTKKINKTSLDKIGNKYDDLLPRYVPKFVYLPEVAEKTDISNDKKGSKSKGKKGSKSKGGEGPLAQNFREGLKVLATKGFLKLLKTQDSLIGPVKIDSRGIQDVNGFKDTKAIVLDDSTSTASFPVKMFCVAADNIVCGKDSNTVITNKLKDLNAYSSAFILEYGSFRYYLGGDLAGHVDSKKVSSSHPDSETHLAGTLKEYFPQSTTFSANAHKFIYDGYCTGFKASHHASSSSNTELMLCAMRPLFVAVSSGFYMKYYAHPSIDNIKIFDKSKTANWNDKTMTAVANTIDKYFVTEIADRNRDKPTGLEVYNNGRIIGSIIVRPTDESVKNIYVASTAGQELCVQVYGTGEFTDNKLVANYKSNLIAAHKEADIPDRHKYPIGFYDLKDTH